MLHSCFYLLTFTFIACQSEVEEVSEMQFVNGNEVVSGNAETRSIICEVTTTAAGQLIEKLEEFGTENGCAKEEITELTISGPVNREDLQALQPFEKITKLDMREMTIIDEWGNETSEFPSQSLENFASPAYVYTPNSAYIIRSFAFYNSNIIGVYMHDNTELLDTDSFRDCKNLETINWSTNITKIPNFCFFGCNKLQIEIPEGVTDIGQYAFYGCNDIISLPSTLMSIESYAFENCQGITSLTIPPSVTKWGENVFCNCVNLVTVTGLEEYEAIPKGMFLFCYSLENITLNKVVTIGTDAFSYCESLQNISLPNTLKEIGDAAFHDCISLAEIVLPEGLEKIGFRAFRNTRISEMTFPASLKEVGEGVLEFTGSALKVVYWNCPIEIPRLREKWEGYIPYIYSVPVVAYDKNNGMNVIFGDDESGYVAKRFYISGDQDFYCPKAFTAKQVLYRRHFDRGTNPDNVSSGWETISLPFTASKFIVQDNGEQPERVLKPFGSTDMGDAKPFWLRAYTENGFERATTLEAGKPYIIAFPNNSNLYLPEYNIWGMIEFWGENVSIMPSSEEVTPVTGPEFTMYPTFKDLADVGNNYQIEGTYIQNEKGETVWSEAFVLGTSWVDRFTAYGVANGTSRSVIPIGGNGQSNTRSSVGEGGIPQENDI